MENHRHLLLLGGIRSLIRCDDAEVVRGIASYVLSQHQGVGRMARFVERARDTCIPSMFAVLGWLRAFLAVNPVERANGVAWVARLKNERRAVDQLITIAPELGWTEVTLKSTPKLSNVALLIWTLLGPRRSRTLPCKSRRNLRRVFRIARRLHRQYEFFRVLRVVELVGYYMRYLEVFESGRFSLAVMSSHSNPHAIAFNLAARRFGVPAILITHGMPIRPVAKLSFDLAVVHCEAARRIYSDGECRLGRVLIHGRREQHTAMRYAQLPRDLTVGIFLCKDVKEERVRALVGGLLDDPRVARILIRPHPKNLWLGLDSWIASQKSKVCRGHGSLESDIEGSDIVLGGNSSVLVDAVTAGRPSGYVSDLDYGSPDLHEFVRRGLIYPVEEDRRVDFDALVNFYRQPHWPEVLNHFANIDDDEASVLARGVEIMRELIGAGNSI